MNISLQPLTRPSIHESGSHALRKPPGSISGSSVAGSEAGSSIGSRKGLSRLYGRIFHTKQKEKFTATEVCLEVRFLNSCTYYPYCTQNSQNSGFAAILVMGATSSFLLGKSFVHRGLLIKERICLQTEQIVSLKSSASVKGRQNSSGLECFPFEKYPYTSVL